METALFNIFDLPMILTIFICLILSSVLVISAEDGRHLLLASYLFSMALVELDKVIFWSAPLHRLFDPLIPIVFVIGKCVGLLVFPLLYLYVCKSSNIAKSVSGALTGLCIILVSGVTLSLLLYQSLGNNPDQYWPSNYRNIFFNPYFLMLLFCKYGLFFTFVSMSIGTKHNFLAGNNKIAFANSESGKELNLVLVGALLIYCVEFVADFLALLKMDNAFLNSMGIFHNYAVLSYVCLVLGYMLKRHLLNGSQKSKRRSATAQRSIDAEVEKIHQLMEEQKYYLDSGLTLEGLAKKMRMPEYQLSALLNKNVQKNFYDFINCYRTEHAKKLMTSTIGESHSILEILYDSGFSSKSAFNRCFKKYTGITPTEYRERFKAVSQ